MIRLEDLPLADIVSFLELQPPNLPYRSLTGTPSQYTPTTYRKTTAKAVNTTTAATDLLNGEVTVAANALGTTGMLRLVAWGDILNNTGASTNAPRLRVALGGTTLIDTGAGGATTFGSSASRFPWRVVIEVMNTGAANEQMVSLVGQFQTFASNSSKTSFTTGEGLLLSDANGLFTYQGFATATIDTSTAQALAVNIINPSASASFETKLFGALVEVI